MKKQIIISHGGERLVVLPEADYDALVRAAQAAGVEVEGTGHGRATGRANTLAPEQQARIADGESPIRVWREVRGLSLTELADRAKLLEDDLSELETDQREATVEVLRTLARALHVTIDDLTG